LSLFVEFVQLAIVTEKAWQPPSDDPAGLPAITDADFAARSRALPAAERERLLRLLFLIIKTERPGWAGLQYNPETGRWTVSLSRQIREFANVRDIDDYWSRRYKPWESGNPARQQPLAPDAGGPAPATGNNSRSHAAANLSAEATPGAFRGHLAGADPGAARVPGAAHGEDHPAPRLARTSGVQVGSGNVQFKYFYDSPARAGSGDTADPRLRRARPTLPRACFHLVCP
jgi:hypothetical protein